VHGRRGGARQGLPGADGSLSKLEFGQGSQVNVPIGVLLWLMIYPMMLKVDFSAIGGIARKPKGLMVTLFVNWLVKPFSMALLAWVFMQHVFAAWIDAGNGPEYTAGLIILAAAPCTAMVFVWSYLTDGDPAYTLVQVAVNDLIMLVAFAPIVMFLCGVAHVVVPAKVLITSVVVFIVIPLTAGWLTRTALLKSHGKEWFEQKFLPKFHPVMIGALLLTLVLIFAFQSEKPDQPLAGGPAHRGAHHHPGLFQLRAGPICSCAASGWSTTSPRPAR
jgi:ACR3 family arsenite transporter